MFYPHIRAPCFKMTQRLAVVGSRTMTDDKIFNNIVTEWVRENGVPECIVTGCARGADALARKYAETHQIPLVVKRADWQKHGKAAGPKRNSQIVADCTAMIAFVGVKSVGTLDSLRKARAAKKSVTVERGDF